MINHADGLSCLEIDTLMIQEKVEKAFTLLSGSDNSSSDIKCPMQNAQINNLIITISSWSINKNRIFIFLK
jgi:hypothetical protein